MEILIPETQIQQRVKELGAEISSDYQGKDLLIICVLKGAVIFLADLLRALSIPVEVDFVKLSSYGQKSESDGVVKALQGLSCDIEQKDVLILEDIVDTGVTLSYLLTELKSKNPASLKVCALLDKPSRRIKPVPIEYVGFQIPNYFVVGYGLDYAEKFRNLPYIRIFRLFLNCPLN